MMSATSSAKVRLYNWSFPGSPIQIQLRLDVVDALARVVQSESPGNPNNARETGGILLGMITANGTRVEVVHSRPFKSSYWTGGGRYVLQSSDRKLLSTTIAESKLQPGAPAVVGFYRTHLRPDLSLDDDDLAVMRECFPDPSSVALIIKPSPTGPPVAGFFFSDKGQINSQFSYLEFPFDAIELAESTRNLPKPQIERASMATDGRVWWPPQWLSAAGPLLRSRRTWILAAILLCAVALFFYRNTLVNQIQARTAGVRSSESKPAAPGIMGLQVETRGADLRVSWNRAGTALANAKIGILSIKDGETERRVYLDPNQLKTGSAMYSPVSDNVQFRLEILSPTGESADEQVVALVPAKAFRESASSADRQLPSIDRLRFPPAKKSPDPSANVRAAEQPLQAKQPARAFESAKASQRPEAAATEDIPAPPPTLVPATTSQRDILSDALSARVPLVAPPTAKPATPVPERRLSPPDQSAPEGQQRPATLSGYLPPQPLRQIQAAIPGNVRAMLTSEVLVEVQVSLDEMGRITKTRVDNVKGPMSGFLSTPALEAARRWTFRPARLSNQNVPSEITLRFRFGPANKQP